MKNWIKLNILTPAGATIYKHVKRPVAMYVYDQTWRLYKFAEGSTSHSAINAIMGLERKRKPQ